MVLCHMTEGRVQIRPFCPKCGKETEQTTMWPDRDKDRNLARCASCGWRGYAYECKAKP